MGEEEGRVTGIWHIVRLRGMLQKWHSHTVRPKEDKGMPPSIPPVINKRLKMVTISCDSDDDQCQSPEPPPDVPRGYLAVYVGEEHRRFVIPTNYLGQPVFRALLSKAEEEFGFDHNGALTFPCDIETFKYILQCMERHNRGLIDDEGNPINIRE